MKQVKDTSDTESKQEKAALRKGINIGLLIGFLFFAPKDALYDLIAYSEYSPFSKYTEQTEGRVTSVFYAPTLPQYRELTEGHLTIDYSFEHQGEQFIDTYSFDLKKFSEEEAEMIEQKLKDILFVQVKYDPSNPKKSKFLVDETFHL